MNPHLGAVAFLRFLLNWLFFAPVNYWWGLPCNSQRSSMYGFNKAISPYDGTTYGGFHDWHTPFNFDLSPPPSSEFSSDYGLAILKGISTIMKALVL